PESGVWVNAASGEEDRVLEFGETITYDLSGATDSETFTNLMPAADLCFEPNVLGAGGAARISVYRVVVASFPTINASILLPTIPIDSSDCTVLVNGTYWVEVTTAPGGGEAGVVSVTARSN
ncbi:MAG: hypothetical protein K2Q20_14035, partial [Phycisphaerales bacterium]|nr:hypothetical protein [Phycisphaerales bacterium]